MFVRTRKKRCIIHSWGDKDVDWQGINDCADWIGQELTSFFPDWVQQTKEKWGMVVVYCYAPHNEEAEIFYRETYKKAIEKWPHLKQEILQGADWSEYLEGL